MVGGKGTLLNNETLSLYCLAHPVTFRSTLDTSCPLSRCRAFRLCNTLQPCKRPQSALLQAKAYGTRCSQAVPHPSTILARRCLTSVIRRERVCSSWYGRRQLESILGQCRDVFGIFSRLAWARHKLCLVWTWFPGQGRLLGYR